MPSSFLSYNSPNSRKAKDFHATSYVQGQCSMCPKPRTPFFLFTSIGVQNWPVLVEVSAPTRLALRGSHVQRLPETDSFTQQKQYHKRTTLRTLKLPLRSIRSEEGSHYCLGAKRKKAIIRQATNAIYGMGTLKIPLWSIRSEEDPHYCLGAKREEAVIRQATINLFTSLDIPWWFHTRSVLCSLANARKCQLKDFCEEERYESCSVQQTFTAETFGKRRKRENSMVVMLLPGSHKRLALRNPCILFQKHGGACTMYKHEEISK